MKQIIVLYLHALKEKLFIAFMMFVLEAIKKFEVIGQKFPYYVSQLRAAYDELNRVYLKFDADFCTEMVQEADKKRNTEFTSMRNAIRAHILLEESEAKTQAAEVLLKIIELYGGTGITTQGITAKTTSIVNLIEDFEEKYAAEVETLGIGDKLDALKLAQQDFDEKYMHRAECDSEFEKGAMAEARKRMTKAYHDFVTIVNLEAQHDADGELTEFIKLMNVEIGRYRTYTGQGQVDGSTDTEFAMATATFHFFDHHEEIIQQLVGSILNAPTNTVGYYWDPTVPATMPAEDTAYYELPDAEQQPTLYKIDFIHGGETVASYDLEAGARVTAPTPPTGYRWVDVPATMPARNVTIYSELDDELPPSLE